MRERSVKPLAPRRRELPCSFAPTKSARVKAVLWSVLMLPMGALLVWAAVTAGSGTSGRIIFGALGLFLVVAAWYHASGAFVAAEIRESGVRVMRFGRVREMRWEEIGRISFGATRTSNRAPGSARGGLAGVILDAALDDDDDRSGDPYFMGRARQQFDPSAKIRSAADRVVASLPAALGWPFFMALYAEAAARGIEIVRTW